MSLIRNKFLVIIGLIAILMFSFLCIRLILKGSYSSDKASNAIYTIQRQVQYSYTLINSTNRVIPLAELWAFGPVAQTATQKCISLSTSQPNEIIKDELGNQILHFTFKNFPPYGTKNVSIQADLMLSTSPNVLPSEDLMRYISAEKYIEADNPLIVAKAKGLKTTKNNEIIAAIFDFTTQHVQYTSYLSQDRGALYALENGKGDCTEFADLFVALARAVKIPARTLGGYICQNNAVLRAQSYHNWAEFMEDGAWKISDPQSKVLRQNQSHYIALRIFGAVESPLEAHHRFRYSGNGLKVKMN